MAEFTILTSWSV